MVYDFSINGVGTNIQFGINGLVIASSASLGQFSFFTANGTTLVPVVIAAPSSTNHAATKAYVDNLGTEIGLSGGTYSPIITAHYIYNATSINNATSILDTTLYTAITNTGLNSNGQYTANSGAHYINTATSIINSINLLDTNVYNNNTALITTISKIETSVGLSTLGSYVVPTSNYLGSTTSVMNALTELDTQIFDINSLNLSSRVSSLETFETSTNNEFTQQASYIANINTSSGFSATGSQLGFTSLNFISMSDSLTSAISKLDTEAQVLSSNISSLNSTVSTLNTNVGAPGTYTKVVTDSLGRVSSGSQLSESDITTALTYTPFDSSGGTIYGNVVITDNISASSGSFAVRPVFGSYTPWDSGNLIFPTTTPGTYNTLTINSSGLVTGASNQNYLTTTSAYDVLLTTINQTTISTTVVNATANILANIFYRVVGNSTDVSITLSYTDNSGTTQNITVVTAPSQPIGNYTVAPTFINVGASHSLAILATAATANQVYVSTSIIQL